MRFISEILFNSLALYTKNFQQRLQAAQKCLTPDKRITIRIQVIKAVITIAIRLRYDYDPTMIRVRYDYDVYRCIAYITTVIRLRYDYDTTTTKN